MISFVIVFLVFMQIGCEDRKVNNSKAYPQTPSAINDIKNLRIFLGHQSIGENVLNGLSSLEGFDIPIVNIREEKIPSNGGVFLHTFIGRNKYPNEKIRDFSEIMSSIESKQIDVSFMKFCYVDINQKLTADQIFSMYVQEMERLEDEYPSTTFVYFTMPLTRPRDNIKNLIKRVLNMPLYGLEENIERQRFNDRLRDSKRGTGRLFDIALIESTRPDGSRSTFSKNGSNYELLYNDYTYDGEHLNELGRSIVAQELIRFLSEI